MRGRQILTERIYAAGSHLGPTPFMSSDTPSGHFKSVFQDIQHPFYLLLWARVDPSNFALTEMSHFGIMTENLARLVRLVMIALHGYNTSFSTDVAF
jgi:hypothetical protein